MRDSASAVVIGGGVGGCSVLYWLTRLGWDDAVLVERADLTSGSTFHSAGLVGQLRSSLSLTKMMMESVDLYRSLEAEVGLETGWREVGSLRLASSNQLKRPSSPWSETAELGLSKPTSWNTSAARVGSPASMSTSPRITPPPPTSLKDVATRKGCA